MRTEFGFFDCFVFHAFEFNENCLSLPNLKFEINRYNLKSRGATRKKPPTKYHSNHSGAAGFDTSGRQTTAALNGKPLILHTLEQTKKARNIERVIVATDDEKILNLVKESGNEAVLTSVKHQSGSDRIAEVAETLPENSIIVNVQGDEPLISPDTIDTAIEAILNDESADISTTCEKIETVKMF